MPEKPTPEAGQSDFTVVIIGATGGIGGAIAWKMAAEGYNLALGYCSNRGKAEALAEKLVVCGQRISVHEIDTRKPQSVGNAFDDLAKLEGGYQSIVFAAGSDIDQPYLANVCADDWNEVIAAEMTGFFHVAQNAIPHFRQQEKGSFVLLSSAAGRRTTPRDILSVAPKMGAEAIMRYIAAEEGKYGIRANGVGVGVINAGIFHRLIEKNELDAQWREKAINRIPMRRFGEAEEVANAVCFLAGDQSSYITGQLLFVDGGYAV